MSHLLRPARGGHALVEALVALTLLAVGALGAAALFAHAARRLTRTAQLAHARDAARARRSLDAAQPCAAGTRGVQPLVVQWTDSATGAVSVRAEGAPCVE